MNQLFEMLLIIYTNLNHSEWQINNLQRFTCIQLEILCSMKILVTNVLITFFI